MKGELEIPLSGQAAGGGASTQIAGRQELSFLALSSGTLFILGALIGQGQKGGG